MSDDGDAHESETHRLCVRENGEGELTPENYWYAVGADHEVTVFLPGGLYFTGKPAANRDAAATWLKLGAGYSVYFAVADVIAVKSKGA